MKTETRAAVRAILDRLLAGKLTMDEAVTEVIRVTSSQMPLQKVERRQWKRKEFSAEGTMDIAYGLDQRRVSHSEKVLVTNISIGGIRVKTPFLSLDGLHIIGDLTEEAWMPNILNLELVLPVVPPRKISFQGSAEWYLRMGTEASYLIGIAIDVISREHKDALLRFLKEEGNS